MTLINTTVTLEDLPSPPPDKTGWPWTQQSQPLAERMPDGSPWPRISIVTPSYNYGQFIEETIRSVLLQGYPNLEYIVIDGGSTDSTVDIIQKYEKWLTYWVSEPDEGQTDAINKGYHYCTGEIFVWLNADDAYISSNCLHDVSELYRQGYQLIVGECLNVDVNDNPIQVTQQFNGYSKPQSFDEYLKFWSFVPFPQPAVFIAKELTDQAFPLDKALYRTMDYQLFVRVLSQCPKSIWIKHTWVKFKYHGENKTMKSYRESYSELQSVALAEAQKIPKFLQKMHFLICSKDYMQIALIMDKYEQLNTIEVLAYLFYRPTLVRWGIFWKLLLKKYLGNQRYNEIKKLLQ
ncbi:MAG TPA: glycosyltransferase [Cyanobacteria bacterium UBA8803]|nr:glycosyltransferase [Cyanobacteria bacterium UBA9273]HBL61324.1 glycosyltransferase [Cyanobacteria bacterium UBA8803]